ncbi:MAG: hypothetical protein IH951_00720 [Bacteroidetes bacterium]|nr:hypothetical protein [Bacteroidota bacterium]
MPKHPDSVMRRYFIVIQAALLFATPSFAQELTHVEGLGSIYFPNSGSEEAQDDFIRGVLLLHSFEFGPSAQAFKSAQEKDPDFAMAYWGEAMTYNHPLWRAKDEQAASDVFARMPSTAPTDRENGYLNAVRILYAPGESKEDQDRAYMEAMKRLSEAFPEDDEARAFYAISILGSLNGEREFATYMKAAAAAAGVFKRNPNHPGGVHYLIHSFDDPVHAPLGLPAADAYSKIAPNAAHGQHMTSHIFVAMGLWDRVVSANIIASAVQDAVRAEGGRGPNVCGHYSSWLHYGRLMQGEFEEAEVLMDACHERVASGNPSGGEWGYFVSMRARHIMDSEMWSLANRWTANPPRWSIEQMASRAGISGGRYFTYILTDAIAGLHQGDATTAHTVLDDDWGPSPGRVVQLNQLRGLLAIQEGDRDAGIALLAEAAAGEDAVPFEFGPPRLVKPTYESLGSALLAAGRNGEAEIAFRRAAERTPGRTLATKGLNAAAVDGTDD